MLKKAVIWLIQNNSNLPTFIFIFCDVIIIPNDAHSEACQTTQITMFHFWKETLILRLGLIQLN